MANTYTTSSIVRLYDQRSPQKLLHPETELSAVVCSSGGLVVISNNNISVPVASVGAVITQSGFIKEPLLEPTTGGTITNIGHSTGYGTLLKTISTTDTIRLPADSASNDYIPTELAVAVALDRKQDKVTSGAFISITPNGAGRDVIAVSPVVTEIRDGTNAVHTALPTEKAVQIAIGLASAAAVTEAITSVTEFNYATESWTTENFLIKGGTHDWGYATYQSAGVVRPIQGSGLSVGANGAISVPLASQYATYAAAKVGSAGIVRVTSEVVSAANAADAAVTVVPTADAVYRAIRNYEKPLPIVGGSGIRVDDSNNSYTIILSSAGVTSIGGVSIPTDGGLALYNGAVTLSAALTQDTYAAAAADKLGGVHVLDNITSTADVSYLASGYVPHVQAVHNAVTGATAAVVSWVNSQGYATEAWVTGQTYGGSEWIKSNFVSTGDNGPMVNWGTATANIYGVVKVPSSNGLSISNGTVSIASAAYNSFGVPQVYTSKGLILNSGVLSLDSAAVVSTYESVTNQLGLNHVGGVVAMSDILTDSAHSSLVASNAPVVPTIAAMKAYVAASGGATVLEAAPIVETIEATTPGLGGVRIVSDGGLQITTGTSAGNLYLDSAAYNKPGGLLVPYDTGLELDGGTLSIASGYKNAFHAQALKTADELDNYPVMSTLVQIQNQLVLDDNGTILYYDPCCSAGASAQSIAGPTETTLYAIVSKTATYTAIETEEAFNSRYQWTGPITLYTLTSSPDIGARVYSSYQNDIIVGYVTGTGTVTNQVNGAAVTHSSITADIWSCTISSGSVTQTADTYVVPIAEVQVNDGTAQSATIYQYQRAPIISGAQIYLGASTASIYSSVDSALTAIANDVGLGGVRLVDDIAGYTASIHSDYALAPTLGAIKTYVSSVGGGGTASIYPTVASATSAADDNVGVGGVWLVDDITDYDPTSHSNYSFAPTLGAVQSAVQSGVASYVSNFGGAASYHGQFKVTSGDNGYEVTGGTIYLDGVGEYLDFDGGSGVTPSTDHIIWLNITKNGPTLADTPSFKTYETSYPLAYASGALVVQYQFGPIVIRGRWG